MKLREKIREANARNDGIAVRKVVDFLIAGGLRTRDGTPVLFNYNAIRDFFGRIEPDIDAARFEDLMLLADYSEMGS